jgi:hypothetical protein
MLALAGRDFPNGIAVDFRALLPQQGAEKLVIPNFEIAHPYLPTQPKPIACFPKGRLHMSTQLLGASTRSYSSLSWLQLRNGVRAIAFCLGLFAVAALLLPAASLRAEHSNPLSRADRARLSAANRTRSAVATLEAEQKPGATAEGIDHLSFGALKAGETSAVKEVTFTFSRNVTLGRIDVLTMGAAKHDFADARTGSCQVARSYAAGESCTVGVTFTPLAAGSRRGAVVLVDSQGQQIHALFTEGSGIRAQMIFLPGTLQNSSLINSEVEIYGVAVDGSGNIFTVGQTGYSDASIYLIKMTAAGVGSYSQSNLFDFTSITSSDIPPNAGGIALDGAGNVWVPDSFQDTGVGLYKFTASSSYAESYFNLGGGILSPNAVAFDASGNMYVADYGSGTPSDGSGGLYKLAWNGSSFGTPSKIMGGEFVAVAVDGNGNVYASYTPTSNSANHASIVYKWPSSLSSHTTVASGFININGISVDPAGNVYLADDGSDGNSAGELFLEEYNGGSYAQSPVSLASTLNQPEAVAVDGDGNVYVPSTNTADTSSTSDQDLYVLNYTTPPTLIFGSVEEGNKSSAQSFEIKNIGNAIFTVSVPGSGTNPSPSSGYLMDPSGTCSIVSSGGSSYSLASNSTCTYAVDFDPNVSSGSENGTVTITDNNGGGTTQVISTTGSVSGATHLVFSTVPSTATVGVPFTVIVTAENSANGTDTGYSGTVHFTSTDGSATLPANATLTNGTGTFTVTLNTTGSKTVTATDTAVTGITATSSSITVQLATATHFTVTASGTDTAGTAVNYTVTALTASNSTATGYSGTVHFTSTDGSATLPGNATLSSGVGTFSATLKTAGAQTITATDTGNSSITGTSNSITVSPAAAASLTIQGPSTVTAGISTTYSITAYDAYGNIATNYTATATLTSSDVQAAFSPSTASIVNGSGSLIVALKTAGTQSISATGGGVGGSKNGISVSPAAAASLSVVSLVGPNFPNWTSASILITAYDAFGNVATGDNETLTLTSSSSAFGHPNPVTLVNGVAGGTPALNIALGIAGPQTVTATGNTTGATGTLSVTVLPGAASQFGVSAPASAYLGSPVAFTVTAYDIWLNVATGYTGTVSFSSTDAAATLPAGSTLTNGVGSFSATFGTTGAQTITATDSANSLSGASSAITVTIPYLVVNTVNDDAGTASNCSVQTTSGTNGTDAACSLRDALLEAANLGTGNITFDHTAFASAQTIALSNGTLTIPSHTSIVGATSGSGPSLTNLVTVNGNNLTTDLTVNSGTTAASISNLTISGGNGNSGNPSEVNAGGIYSAGALTITGSTISGNSAAVSGGGVYLAGGTLTISASTISGNSADSGAGIFIDNGATVKISDSTIAGNSADSGAGIYLNSGSLSLDSDTISGNSAGTGGGLANPNSGTVSLVNTIIAGNSASSSSPDVNGSYTDNGGNQISTAVNLSALGSYGGPTQTLLPLPGSAAICALTGPGITDLNADQRSYSRVTLYGSTDCVDSGAVQTSYSIQFSTEPPSTVSIASAFSPAPVVKVLEQGALNTVATGTVSLTDTASALSGATAAAFTSGYATFNNLQVSSAVTNDSLTATLTVGSSFTVTATSSDFSAVKAGQTLTFPSPVSGTVYVGGSASLSATSTSGLPVGFLSGTPSICTVSGTVGSSWSVSFNAIGQCSIEAYQWGNASYKAAPQVFQNIYVHGLTQTITVNPIGTVTVESATSISATASSSLPVTFTSKTPSICSITVTPGSVLLTASAKGTCTVVATQSGNGTYAAATPVTTNITIHGQAQTITFPAIIEPVTTGTSIPLNATASSNIPVTYASIHPAVCTVSQPGGVWQVNLLTVGECSLVAEQSGNAVYASAPNITQNFYVHP